MTPEQELQLLGTVADTHEQVTKIVVNCAHCQERVAEHHVTLYGNLRPGLRQDVMALNTAVSELKGDAEKNVAWYRDKLGIVIIALLGVVVTLSGAKQVAAWLAPPVVQQPAEK